MTDHSQRSEPVFASAPEPLIYAITTPSRAMADVNAERQRQIAREGFTADHDDDHVGGELIKAACAYGVHATVSVDLMAKGVGPATLLRLRQTGVPDLWPWSPMWWKPSLADPRRDLVKAAALLVAEIERLDRAAGLAAGRAT